MTTGKATRPLGVTVLAVLLMLFGLLAFFGSLFLWGGGFLLSFPAGVDLALPVTDILVNAPASILAAIGLWRLARWGYAASQFVAGFYTYASVDIFVMVAQKGPPYPVAIILPQVLALIVAAALVFYLWRIRTVFR
jgi:hypothetical protein